MRGVTEQLERVSTTARGSGDYHGRSGMSQLRCAFLGTPQVWRDGLILSFPTRKALALLAYLCAESGPHRREQIATLLWPSQDRSQALQALRTTLARLRQSLGDNDRGDVSAPYLLVEHQTVALNFRSGVELDLLALEEALQQQIPPSSATAETHLARLRQAAGLYRGDFLAGFSLPDAPEFEDWVDLQRERWKRNAALIFARLSQLQLDAGDTTGASETARRWIAQEPLDEAAHRLLMQALFIGGDRAGALRAYEICRATLEAELGAEPMPETLALAGWLRNAPPPSRPPSSTGPLVALEPPLVGRETQYARLTQAYNTACHGQVQVVCIEGEAGIGKSRLALEFLGWAAAQGADVLYGQCFAAGSRLPYQPLIQAFRPRLDRENAPDDLLADVWLSELSRLFPELLDRYPDLPPPLTADTAAGNRLFEALGRLALALAGRAPLVLFIDDVHWADAATQELLHYAVVRWSEAGAPILLLLALRSEELATVPDLAEWYAALGRSCSLLQLTLAPLTASDTRRLVAALASEERLESPEIVAQFGDWLYAETGGQPFFISETLKALLEQEVLALRTTELGSWRLDIEPAMRDAGKLKGLIPPRVRELIRTRLARLTSPALALLAAAAVLGHDFSFAQLCRVANLDEDEALPALDQALRGRLLRPTPIQQRRGAPPGYAFVHDKIREIVYTEVGDARRFIFHRRAFEMLRTTVSSPALLAHHALRAGLLDAAFEWSLAAGDTALRFFAVRDAIAAYEQALHALEEWPGEELQHDQISAESWQRLYNQLGRAYELANQFDKARAAYQALLTVARKLGRQDLECAALNRLATVATLDAVDINAAVVLLQQAHAIAKSGGDEVGLAETEWNLAQVRFYNIEMDRALVHGRAALDLARRLGLPELTARSLNVIAYALLGQCRWSEVEAHAVEACTLYQQLGNRAMEVDCLCLVAAARMNSGHLLAGLEAGRAARSISLSIENGWGQAHSAVHLAQGLLEAGQLSEALDMARESIAAARIAGLDHLLPACLARLGAIYRSLLLLDEARASLLEALAHDEQLAPRPFAALINSELCAVSAMAGDWAEAYAAALRTAAARAHALLYTGLNGWLEVEALLRGGAYHPAAALVEQLRCWAAENPRYQIPYMRCKSLLAQHTGNIDEALGLLDEAARLAGELNLPGEEWPIRAALAELYRALGDDTRAQQSMARVALLLRQLAAAVEEPDLQARFLAAAGERYGIELERPSQ